MMYDLDSNEWPYTHYDLRVLWAVSPWTARGNNGFRFFSPHTTFFFFFTFDFKPNAVPPLLHTWAYRWLVSLWVTGERRYAVPPTWPTRPSVYSFEPLSMVTYSSGQTEHECISWKGSGNLKHAYCKSSFSLHAGNPTYRFVSFFFSKNLSRAQFDHCYTSP